MATIVYPDETIQGYRDAAAARFAEAESLYSQTIYDGATYLYGYVAELVIKSSVYLCFGHGLADVITGPPKATYKLIEWMMKEDAMAPQFVHDVMRWTLWLIQHAKPSMEGIVCPVLLQVELERSVDAITSVWRPVLRYHHGVISPSEALVVREAAAWMIANANRL
jgi:hypothetical protein